MPIIRSSWDARICCGTCSCCKLVDVVAAVNNSISNEISQHSNRNDADLCQRFEIDGSAVRAVIT